MQDKLLFRLALEIRDHSLTHIQIYQQDGLPTQHGNELFRMYAMLPFQECLPIQSHLIFYDRYDRQSEHLDFVLGIASSDLFCLMHPIA